MNREMLFDIIYALAASGGREALLFGRNAKAAHDAFERSLASKGFPELWFEIPLAGNPWLDVHMLTSSEDVTPQTQFLPQSTGGYPEAFEWFSRQGADVRQLALSWDVGSRGSAEPAVQLLVARDDPSITCAFLESVGRGDATEAYRSFCARMPKGWFACYAGAFGMRQDLHLRVECIPGSDLQDAYAQDAALLAADLGSVGLSGLGDAVVERCSYLSAFPFQSEFQFDVQPDGTAGQAFSMSLRFATPPGSAGWAAFDTHAAAGELMRKVEAWGLADGRWKALEGCVFSKRIGYEGESCLAYCYPAFVKLRWREGAPLDAKAYLIAGTQSADAPVDGGER